MATGPGNKAVYTTTEASRLCHISKQKIVNLFDEGKIEGFRIPSSGESTGGARRIPRQALLTFMREHGIPTDALEAPAKKKVLIVDDDPSSVELLTAMFEGEDGIVLETATTGSDAAVKAGTFQPDLILLDIMLPDLDGDAIYNSIRKTEELAETEVIIVSALSNTELQEKMAAAGASQYFTKPIDVAKLKDKVIGLLGTG